MISGLIILICLLLYVIGAVLVYGNTSKKLNEQNKEPSPEEAKTLMYMIALYPLFYSEINLIIKHCDERK